jgi:transcriptional regulator with XRE-family HTH domain
MLSIVKTEEREEARRLRQTEGLPIKKIASRLGVAVSTVSLWVRDIELTAEQQARLRFLNPAYNRQLSGQAVYAEQCRARRREAQQGGRVRAGERDALHVAGCMLYWAEGWKNRNQLSFANADPDMIRLFVRFLRSLGVRDERIRVTCHLFADHLARQREVENFWLDVVELPISSLRKSIVNVVPRSSQQKRVNRLPWGTCHVVVSDTLLLQHIYGAIQEYGGFDRDEWLD